MMNRENKMRLEDLLSDVEPVDSSGDLSCEISSIEYDSRKVVPGSLFVALPGEKVDGMTYMEEAVRRGAVAVISQTPCMLGGGFACVKVDNPRLALAQVASTFYDHPMTRLCSVGITGTNGKTTISFMVREIFKAAARRPGLIGTVRYEIGDRILPAARTTPESPDIQALCSQMERSGCDSVIMEVSSHALNQHRVDGIPFDVGVFTNLTQDHLDYHGTLEEYFEVKCRLFAQVNRFAVINHDDAWGQRLLSSCCGSVESIAYGFEEGAQVRGVQLQTDLNGSRMKVESPWGTVDLSLKLIGLFNLSNALAAFATAAALGISTDVIVQALGAMENVPGRLEAIPGRKNKSVFVDYAHTDDALNHVLEALRKITQGKLVVVFGCGGNRDQGKRKLMGEVASRLADYAIITNDNPRSEIPETIAAEIAKGFDSERKYEIILDRRAAIERGVELIGKKDILLVAGKGHEAVQEIGGAIFPFDDRDVVREML